MISHLAVLLSSKNTKRQIFQHNHDYFYHICFHIVFYENKSAERKICKLRAKNNARLFQEAESDFQTLPLFYLRLRVLRISNHLAHSLPLFSLNNNCLSKSWNLASLATDMHRKIGLMDICDQTCKEKTKNNLFEASPSFFPPHLLFHISLLTQQQNQFPSHGFCVYILYMGSCGMLPSF